MTSTETPWPLIQIISGAQTGADQAGLFAAEDLGYATGGMAPLGGRTEDGPRMDLVERFKLRLSRYAGYEHRTRWNVQNSDATVIFSVGALDGGSQLTASIAAACGKPCMVIVCSEVNFGCVQPKDLRAWLQAKGIRILNVAGNREKKSPGIFEAVRRFLGEALVKP